MEDIAEAMARADLHDPHAPNLAALAEREGRDQGDQDGSGEFEVYTTPFRTAIMDLDVKGTKTTGCWIGILWYGAFSLDDLKIYVSSGRHLILESNMVGPFANPGLLCDELIVQVPDPAFHHLHANGIPQTKATSVAPRGSVPRQRIESTCDRIKANTMVHKYLLPFECDQHLHSINISSGGNVIPLMEDQNPNLVRLYHSKYVECSTPQKKTSFLKGIGMHTVINVFLRKAGTVFTATSHLNEKQRNFASSSEGTAILHELGLTLDSPVIERFFAHNLRLKTAFEDWTRQSKAESGIPTFLKGIAPAEMVEEYAVVRAVSRRTLATKRDLRASKAIEFKTQLAKMDDEILSMEDAMYRGKAGAQLMREALALGITDLSDGDQMKYFLFCIKNEDPGEQAAQLRLLLRPSYERIFRGKVESRED